MLSNQLCGLINGDRIDVNIHLMAFFLLNPYYFQKVHSLLLRKYVIKVMNFSKKLSKYFKMAFLCIFNVSNF